MAVLTGEIAAGQPAEPPGAQSPGAQPAAAPGDACDRGGLAAVLEGCDLATATEHFRQCTACQQEFVSRGGVLPGPRPAG
jgi:hypothetical protein